MQPSCTDSRVFLLRVPCPPACPSADSAGSRGAMFNLDAVAVRPRTPPFHTPRTPFAPPLSHASSHPGPFTPTQPDPRPPRVRRRPWSRTQSGWSGSSTARSGWTWSPPSHPAAPRRVACTSPPTYPPANFPPTLPNPSTHPTQPNTPAQQNEVNCIVPLETETQAVFSLVNASAVLGAECAPAAAPDRPAFSPAPLPPRVRFRGQRREA